MAPAPFGAYPAGDDNNSLVRDPVDHIGRYLAEHVTNVSAKLPARTFTMTSTQHPLCSTRGQCLRSANRSSPVAGSSPSHFGQSASRKMTGMRLCNSAMTSFGPQVSIVQLWNSQLSSQSSTSIASSSKDSATW
jgi:hypothetical protein